LFKEKLISKKIHERITKKLENNYNENFF